MSMKTIEEVVKQFNKLFIDSGFSPSTTDNPSEWYEDWKDEPSEVRDWLTQTLKSRDQEVRSEEGEKHAREVNRILNKHSITISQGGLDYVKAFEEMERYEHELFRPLLTTRNKEKEAISNNDV